MENENKNKKPPRKRKQKESFPTTAELQDRLQKVEAKAAQSQGAIPYDSRPRTDKDRSFIAQWFVVGFVLSLFIILIGVPVHNLLAAPGVEQLSVKDVLVSASGYFSGPFGFVIGHYFKSKD